MSEYRYDVRQKIAAVRRVVGDGCSVATVAREMGVSEGSVFFWVRRYRQFEARAHAAGRAHPMHVLEVEPPRELGSLMAYLRRMRA